MITGYEHLYHHLGWQIYATVMRPYTKSFIFDLTLRKNLAFCKKRRPSVQESAFSCTDGRISRLPVDPG